MVATVQTQIKKPGTTPGSSTRHARTPLASFSPLTLNQESTQESQWSFSPASSALHASPSPLTNRPSFTNSTVAQTIAPVASIAPTTPTIPVRIQSPVKPQTTKISGELDDEAEHEADSVAQQSEHVPTASASSTAPPPTSPDSPPQDGGQPLDSTTRATMEPLFGHSFSHVRVHNDIQAAHASQSMQARAYTVGPHIYFNRGEYAPTTSQGRQLLAHELTHVVQQSHTNDAAHRPQGEEQQVQKASLAQHFAANNAFEREAHRASAAVARGERVTVFERTEQALPQREEQQNGSSSVGYWERLKQAGSATEEYLAEHAKKEILDLVQEYAPQLTPILQKGVFAWLEEHITAAIQGAFDTLMAPVRTVTGVVQELSTHFTELLTWMKGAAEQIRRGDCSAITEATHKIQQVIDGFASPIINKVKELASKVGNFFKNVWDQFGAPVWDWLKKVGGEAWQKIQEFATSVWKWTEPIRKLGESAWHWIKVKLGIGDGPDEQNGLLQWIEDKAAEVWKKLKEKLEPIKKPLMVIGGILLLLSPAGPLIEFGAAVYGIIVGIRWIRQHLSTPDGVVNARVVLQKVIIPQILGAVKGFTGKLTQIASSITERLNGVMGGLGNLIGAIGASILSFAVSAIQWIADQFKALVDWANNKLNALVEWVTTGLERLHTFLQPVLDFLGKVASVIGDILQLPFLIAGKLWNMIPACIRDPFVNFLIQHILNHIPILKSIIAIPNIWEKLKAQAMTIIHQIFKQGDLMGALVSIFKLLLTVMKIPLELVTGIFTKAANAFDLIMKDPFAFLKNILGAIKLGFMQFFRNIGKHLLDGVADWLFDSLSETGLHIHIPRAFTLSAVFTFVLDVLDIQEEKIWHKLQEKLNLSPAQMKMLRTVRKAIAGAWEWVTTLINEGPGALWKHLTEKLSDLWHAVLNGVIDWVTTHIIQGAMQWLLGFLDPTGITEIIESIVAIYRSIQSAFQYAVKILRIIDTILDSIIGIAQGVLGPVATMLENALARGLPVVIGYLANLIGAGDIGESIQDIVGAVREKVDEGLDWLIDKAIAAGKALLGALGLGGEEKDTKDKDQPTDVRGQAKTLLRQRLKQEHTRPQIEEIVGQVLVELQPQGLKRLEVETPVDKATTSLKIFAEASPFEELMELADAETDKNIYVYMGATITFFGEGEISPLQGIGNVSKRRDPKTGQMVNINTRMVEPPKGQEDKGSASGGLIRVPEEGSSKVAPDELQVVTWNTGYPVSGSNSSHAEAQFVEWLKGQYNNRREWSQRIKRIDIRITKSPCHLCAIDLSKIAQYAPNLENAVLVYDEAYIDRNNQITTTVEDLDNMRTEKWQITAKNPKEAVKGDKGGDKEGNIKYIPKL